MFIFGNYLLILTCLIQTPSYAQQHPKSNFSCNPSACGNIHAISYPFRLKDDPENCGYPDRAYELSCENNTTASVYLDNLKYHVRAINYHNHTIRLADPSIKINDSCSFPSYSPDWRELMNYGDSSAYRYWIQEFYDSGMVWPVTFLSCPFQLNDPLFIETNQCVSLSSNIYIKAGDLDLNDLSWDRCRIDLVVMTSLQPKEAKNDLSLLKIHESLLYGFELSWSDGTTDRCFRIFVHYLFSSIDPRNGIYFWKQIFSSELFGYPGYRNPYFWKWIFTIDFYGYTGTCYKLLLYFEMLARMIIILVYPTVFCLVLRILVGFPFLLGLIIYKLRRQHLSMFDLIEGFLQSQNNLMPIRYSYTDIKKMTRGFREKLGQGGYGSVYKGKLRSGSIVAIKVLSNPSTNGQDFINEVATMGRIHHINVVKLIGYCVERSKCALVYDFMPNGSLEKYIYTEKTENRSLSWDRKYEIAVGVARGIEYLHRGCDIQILHFDIKPHNVLLDDNFNPKISDFGLAKFYSTEKNIVTLTAARGTIGYVAPELINRSIGGVSYKADVYSFGMLLVDLVGLKRNLAANDDNSSQYFPHWIYDCLNKGTDIGIAKTDNIDDESVGKITRRMTIVALWCIQMSPDDRPSMSKVLEMLETDTELLQIPPHPSEFDQQVAQIEDKTWGTYSTDSTALLCDGSSLGQDL